MGEKDIKAAKEVLEEAGFFVDNLWHVTDVKHLFECTDDEAQEILREALTNDVTMEQVWFAIREFAELEGLKEKEDGSL